MILLDSTTTKAEQNFWGIRGELWCPASQFCAGPWCHTGVVVERVEGKIIIIFLLLVLILLHLLTIVLHVCSVCLLLIHAKKLPSTGCGGPGPACAFAICFMTFVRTAQAPISSWRRCSRPWGPTGTHLHLRWNRWRPGWAEDKLAVALCTLEAPPPSRTHAENGKYHFLLI